MACFSLNRSATSGILVMKSKKVLMEWTNSAAGVAREGTSSAATSVTMPSARAAFVETLGGRLSWTS